MNEWHKATYSQAQSGCVEVKEEHWTVSVRDTRNRRAGHLSFSASEWKAFLADVRTDRL